MKENVRLAPWADVVYGCDGPWWANQNGLKSFPGIKLAHDTSICARYPDINKIEIIERDRLLFEAPGTVGSGGNSGFQALNIALQFGARRVLLVGFDMHGTDGLHWYGRNVGKGMRNPHDSSFMRWRKAFASQAPVLLAMGVDVVNASPKSALTCFRFGSVEETLKEWECRVR